eukprot:Skav209939  [mRNA]  locus=scaffold102:337511:352395:+ [translate_table: standard]
MGPAHPGINSLVARDEDLAADTALVAKLKVGKEPLEDGGRPTYDVGRGDMTWDVEQVLAEQTQRRLAFAVDESLTEGLISPKDLENCKAPIKALVLKPSLQGLEQTAAMAKLAEELGAVCVLSSAFESGVALCHFALLAATLAPAWAADVAQGLGTFTRLSEDVLEPPFADLVTVGPRGWQVNSCCCQEVKRFELFREDVRDLVELTVGRFLAQLWDNPRG